MRQASRPGAGPPTVLGGWSPAGRARHRSGAQMGARGALLSALRLLAGSARSPRRALRARASCRGRTCASTLGPGCTRGRAPTSRSAWGGPRASVGRSMMRGGPLVRRRRWQRSAFREGCTVLQVAAAPASEQVRAEAALRRRTETGGLGVRLEVVFVQSRRHAGSPCSVTAASSISAYVPSSFYQAPRMRSRRSTDSQPPSGHGITTRSPLLRAPDRQDARRFETAAPSRRSPRATGWGSVGSGCPAPPSSARPRRSGSRRRCGRCACRSERWTRRIRRRDARGSR
jgi:hypothetical protein